VLQDPASVALDGALTEVASLLSSAAGGTDPYACVPDRLAQVERARFPALELLRLCLPGRDGADPSARCRVTRLSLGEQANLELETYYSELLAGENALCASSYSARALWSEDRIRSAREVVALWHCIRSGQCLCQQEDGSLGPVFNDCASVVEAPVDGLERVVYARTGDRAVSRSGTPADLGAFADSSFSGLSGWNGGCWSDGAAVGGACADGTRDSVEGPRDIYGRLLGQEGACGACSDGLDNNCNGLVDAEDPGCYPCLQSQGFACACNRETAQDSLEGVAGSAALGMMPLIGLWIRRRRRPMGCSRVPSQAPDGSRADAGSRGGAP
jgi:hypothetical protein